MGNALLTWLRAFPPEISTALLAALPVTELRGSLPVALTAFHLSVPVAIFFAWIGNIVPGILILCWFPSVLTWLERHLPTVGRWMDAHIRPRMASFRKVQDQFGVYALFVYVAFPSPPFGIWSGAALAGLFKIPLRLSIPAALAGSAVSCVLIVLIVQGALGFLSWML